MYLKAESAEKRAGHVNAELMSIAGTSREPLAGVYAAQHTTRLRLGALWEYPELGITRESWKYHGVSVTEIVSKKRVTREAMAWYERLRRHGVT